LQEKNARRRDFFAALTRRARVAARGRWPAPSCARAATLAGDCHRACRRSWERFGARRKLARAAGARASAQFSLALHPRVGKLLLQILLMGGENLTVTRRRE
jgi:hypothetical protein